ncbi:MAG: HDOD domain-containing protein [Planctomycetales bacterium]|nr:HDOD domain-containing protein [Planctomycetales bacterium]
MSNQTQVEKASCSDTLDVIDDLVRSGKYEVPLLPEAAAQVISICNDIDATPLQIANCIKRDPSMAAHLLKVSNSSMYGCGTEIVSLQQAIARLGINRIREIALIVSCKTRVFSVPRYENEVRESFKRSLGAAVFGQEISRVRRRNVEDGFLSGLLHDIGTPVLLQAISDYETENDIAFDRPTVLGKVNERRFDVAHGVITAWNLPDRLGQQISELGSSAIQDASQETQTLILASVLSENLFAETPLAAEEICQLEVTQLLNLYQEQIAEILRKEDDARELIGEAS